MPTTEADREVRRARRVGATQRARVLALPEMHCRCYDGRLFLNASPMTQPRNPIVLGASCAVWSRAAHVGAAPRSGGLKAPI
jgi:hypothetical protein